MGDKATHPLNYIEATLRRRDGVDKEKIAGRDSVFDYAEKLSYYDILRYGTYRSLLMEGVLYR